MRLWDFVQYPLNAISKSDDYLYSTAEVAPWCSKACVAIVARLQSGPACLTPMQFSLTNWAREDIHKPLYTWRLSKFMWEFSDLSSLSKHEHYYGLQCAACEQKFFIAYLVLSCQLTVHDCLHASWFSACTVWVTVVMKLLSLVSSASEVAA